MFKARTYMHPDEIVTWFKGRLRGTVRQRLDVLAQLNDCTSADIADLLELHGVDPETVTDDKDIDLEYVLQCVRGGESFRQVGERLGIRMENVRLRKQRGGNSIALLREMRSAQMQEIDANRDLVLAMYHTGATDRNVSTALGIPARIARDWRYDHGIPSHHIRTRSGVPAY